MKVKVCGITDVNQMIELDNLSVDYIGINFYEKSKRYYNTGNSLKSIELKNAKKVGVFVNASIEFVKEKIETHDLQFVQLHGDESLQYCKELSPLISIIKVFPSNKINLALCYEYKKNCTHFLFDTANEEYGGSGKKFDWNILNNIESPLPYFLAGGISIEDANELKTLENIFAVDINSQFEWSPGIKDIALIKEFISKLKK